MHEKYSTREVFRDKYSTQLRLMLYFPYITRSVALTIHKHYEHNKGNRSAFTKV